MPGAFLGGVAVALVAGFANGAFALPLRYARKWEWENTWLIYSIFALVLFPWIAALVFVPRLGDMLHTIPVSYYIPAVIAGVFWGVSLVLYGLGLNMVGIAVGNAVVASTSTIAGTLGPLIVYAPDKLLTSTGLIFIVAIVLIVSGLYTYSKAGIQKEKESAAQSDVSAGRGSFRAGMIICLTTGALGTVFIYGMNSSTGLLRATAAAGATPVFVGCVALAVTFTTGFIANLIYCLYKLKRNRTFVRFASSDVLARNTSLALLMGVLWFFALLMYGVAAVMMGRLGPSTGFGLFVSGTILFANLLGWWAGEWKGASKATIRGFLRGMVLVLIAIIVIAFGVH